MIGWLFFGAVIGIVAKLVLPGRDPNSALVPPILGVMGAAIGGVAGDSLGGAIVGSIVLVAVYGITTGRITGSPRAGERNRNPQPESVRRNQIGRAGASGAGMLATGMNSAGPAGPADVSIRKRP